MSDLVREPIEQWLEGKPAPAAKNDDALAKRIAELEAQVAGGQKRAEAILKAALGNTAGARYLANLAVAYCDDVISYLATNKPLDDRSKALRDAQRQAYEDAIAAGCIKEVLEGLT